MGNNKFYAVAATFAAMVPLAACSTVQEAKTVTETISEISIGPGFKACMAREATYQDALLVAGVTAGGSVAPTAEDGFALTLSNIQVRDGLGNRFERCALENLQRRGATVASAKESEKMGAAAKAIERLTGAETQAKATSVATQKGLDPNAHYAGFKAAVADWLNKELRASYTLTVTVSGVNITGDDTKSYQTETSFWQPTLGVELIQFDKGPQLIWRGEKVDGAEIRISLTRTSTFNRQLRQAVSAVDDGVSSLKNAVTSESSSFLSSAYPDLANIGGELIGDIAGAIANAAKREVDHYIEPRTTIFSGEYLLYTSTPGHKNQQIAATERLTLGKGSTLCLAAQLPPKATEKAPVTEVTCSDDLKGRLLFQAELTGTVVPGQK